MFAFIKLQRSGWNWVWDINPLKFLFGFWLGYKNKNGINFPTNEVHQEAEVPSTPQGKLVVLWMIPQRVKQIFRLEFTNADAVHCGEQGEV